LIPIKRSWEVRARQCQERFQRHVRWKINKNRAWQKRGKARWLANLAGVLQHAEAPFSQISQRTSFRRCPKTLAVF